MKKVLTTIVAVMMMSVMFVGCIGYDSDAAGEEYHGLTPIHFMNDEESEVRQFTVNEGEYLGYKYEMSIYISSDANTFNKSNLVLTVNSSGGSDRVTKESGIETVGNLEIELKDLSPEIGTYSIEVDRPDDDDDVHDLYIKITMNVVIGTQKIELSPIHYKLPITAGDTSSDKLLFISMDKFTVGKYRQETIKYAIQSGDATIDAYHWYATNLPNGLSMSEDGIISGIPEVDGNYVAEIFASEHNDGEVRFGNLNITVNKAVNDPISNSYDFRISGGVSGKQINCFDYVAIEDEKVVLELLKNGTIEKIEDITIELNDGTYISTVKKDNNGYIHANTEFDANSECILDTTGSGCYKVNISYNGHVTTFHLYVIPGFDIIEAQIMISSS